MKLLFYLHHPAQFHLFKNVIADLKQRHDIIIIATKKDILLDLLDNQRWHYINILPTGRKDNKLSIALSLIKQDIRLYKVCRKFRPDILIGTSTEITHVGRLLGIKSLFFIEDDLRVVPLVGLLAHPFASYIISPSVCDNGRWNNKTIKYFGYQKLSYLHPKYFSPNVEKIDPKIGVDKPFFILRLSKLGAHHDGGVKGISETLLSMLVSILEKKGKVLISSESKLPNHLSKYEMNININDIHHYLFYCGLFISDSQSMSVEASILGTPNLRISSFVGKISVLEELEHKYKLTRAFNPEQEIEILKHVMEVIDNPISNIENQSKRRVMLNDKICVSDFIIWLIEKFPASIEESIDLTNMKERFKSL